MGEMVDAGMIELPRKKPSNAAFCDNTNVRLEGMR